MKRIIISTDMDGTLLDHDSYDCAPALPLLRKLANADIPVILNTSKTAAEIQSWQQTLGLRLPAIIENGSAILTPPGSGDDSQDPVLHIYGATMVDLEAFLEEIHPAAINFVTCPSELATRLTGLQGIALAAARDRHFSIPLKFSDSLAAQHFSATAQARGLQCIQGGRFFSLQGQCDKGTTLKHLINRYQEAWQSKVTVIALGDNHNDLGMLSNADVPVVVKSPSGHLVTVPDPITIYTDHPAPDGWVEGVTRALATLSIHL
tara:strand:+ start:4836 stop:5624 length:789 start_codon:yes stop_codon:yes gene_type:complete